MAKEPHAPRNQSLNESGIMRFSRARMYRIKGIHKKKSFQPVKKVAIKKEKFVRKEIGGDKNGGYRMVPVERKPRGFDSEKPKIKRPRTKGPSKTPRLRSSLTPGAIVILLTSQHKGKRCVFLKQLKSGCLLVTGPMTLNGCPLRRINQVHVIATKQKLDISGLNLPERLDDDYFRRKKRDRKRSKSLEDQVIFATKKEGYELTEQRKEDQRVVDQQLVDLVKNHPDKAIMRAYLATPFGLRRYEYPHRMVF